MVWIECVWTDCRFVEFRFLIEPCCSQIDCSFLASRVRHLLPQTFRAPEALRIKPNRVKIKASGMVIPHPEKVRKGVKALNKNGRGLGGEDAYFYVFGK